MRGSLSGRLLFFGARHTNDPADPQLDGIELLEEFPAERLKLFYFLRHVHGYRGGQPEEYAAGILKLLARVPGLEGPPRTLEDVAQRIPEWRRVPEGWFHPLKNEAFTNELSRRTSLVRDRHMLKTLTEAVRNGERVFAVAGSGHVVMLERALRAALNP